MTFRSTPTTRAALRHTLAVADDDFLAGTAHRYTHVVELPHSPERVWELLCADDALVSWSPLITGIEWTSPRPFGIGSTRIVTLGGFVRLAERFYRWDTGSRMTFTVDSASIPGLNRFAEDLVLYPSATGTSLVWTFALEGNSLLQPLLGAASPVNRLVTRAIAHGITSAPRTAAVAE